MSRLSLSILAGLLFFPFVCAQDSTRSGEPKLEPIKLTVRPAAAPVPAMKYKLLPDGKDLTPGNAALLYYRSFSPEWSWYNRKPEFWGNVDKWLNMPLEQLPLNDLTWVNGGQLKEADLAARRMYCDWELEPRARKEGFYLLLPDLQSFRPMSNLLGVRTRVRLAEGRIDEAIHSLQTSFALGRHVSDGPTLIQSLVGVVINVNCTTRVEELLQQPNAPNLYWALSDLPRPLCQLRRPLDGEQMMLYWLIPNLDEIENKAMSIGEIQEIMDRLQRVVHQPEDQPGLWADAEFVARTVKAYPAAKKFLLAKGVPEARVQAMPALQVVLIYSLDEYYRIRDETYKWQNFPYYQARAGLLKAEDMVKAAHANPQGIPFASLLLPGFIKVFTAHAKLDRKIAALRAIEAIRLHAAANKGKLPESLADITEVLVPIDPATGKEFNYRATGDRFVLEAPAASRPWVPGLLYEVTVKQ
jgi:hypothetical protein